MAHIPSYISVILGLVFMLSPTKVIAQRGPVDFYDCSGKPDGNYVHPSDCSKFIACVAGIYAYEMDCVAGLNYDPVNNRCDYPDVVGCITDPVTTTTTSTTTRPTTTTTPTTSPTTRPTTSPTTRPTTSPTTRPTTTTAPTTTASSTTSSEPPIFNCSGLPDGNYKHPTDCTKFISCVAGEYAYEMDCPEGLHYDPSTDKCDYPEIAGCDPLYTTTTTTNSPSTTTTAPTTSPSSTTSTEGPTTNSTTSNTTPSNTPTSAISSTTTTTTSQPPVFNCSGLPDGNYKHPTDCSKFISCVAGEYAYEMDCPEGLHYDPTTDQCDYPEIVGCNTSSTTTSPTTTSSSTTTTNGTTTGQPETTTGSSVPTTTGTPPTNATSTSAPPTNSTSTSTPPTNATTTVDPDACDHDCQYVGIDCHNYYSCIDFSRKEYHECSFELGLAFNPILLVCDRIENVPGCDGDTTTDLPTTPENECGCEYRPHETDCGKYYFCADSCRRTSCEVQTCPGGLLWSVDFYGDGSAHQQCTLPERATCASKDSGAAHLEFSCYKKDDGLYGNEYNCHSYWKCNSGVALLYACPRGFIYNPEIKSCDFPGRSLRFCTNNE